MRVMMLTLSLNLSGQTVHIRNLGKGLIARGHEVIVATAELASGKPLGKEYLEKAGISVIPIPVANLGAGLPSFTLESFIAGWSLRRILKHCRPDVVHLHAVTMVPQVHFARSLLRHAPTVIATFNNENISPKKRKLGRLACKIFRYALGRRVLAISSEMVDTIHAKIGVDRNLIRLISYSVDDKHFQPPTGDQRLTARQQMDLAEHEIAICCVARLEPRKNQHRLIRAVGALRGAACPYGFYWLAMISAIKGANSVRWPCTSSATAP